MRAELLHAITWLVRDAVALAQRSDCPAAVKQACESAALEIARAVSLVEAAEVGDLVVKGPQA